MILWHKLKGKVPNFYEESNTILLKDIKQDQNKGKECTVLFDGNITCLWYRLFFQNYIKIQCDSNLKSIFRVMLWPLCQCESFSLLVCLQTWNYLLIVRRHLCTNKAWGEGGNCLVLTKVVGAGEWAWQYTKSQEKFSEN